MNIEKIEKRRFNWEPLSDITVWELAQLVPYFNFNLPYDKLEEKLKRHIKVVEKE